MTRARASLLGLIAASVCCGALPAVTWTTHARAQTDEGQATPVDVPQGDGYADTDPSALTDFDAALDPHGTWVDDPTYGTAWTPNPNEVGADFVPYDTAGRWDYVGGDYSWVSDFEWGWVCFHYGRWVWSAGAWLWIPGRLYAGAWVDWRVGDGAYGYIGWAPMPPAWGWSGGAAVSLGVSAAEPWSFAQPGGMFGPGLPSRVVTGSAAAPLVGHTRPYVHARPTVAGQALLQPIMQGPSPTLFGIDPAQIPHAPPNAREVRARQLAHPSTAQPLGAHPPTPHVFRVPPRRIAPSRGYGAPGGGGGRGRR